MCSNDYRIIRSIAPMSSCHGPLLRACRSCASRLKARQCGHAGRLRYFKVRSAGSSKPFAYEGSVSVRRRHPIFTSSNGRRVLLVRRCGRCPSRRVIPHESTSRGLFEGVALRSSSRALRMTRPRNIEVADSILLISTEPATVLCLER